MGVKTYVDGGNEDVFSKAFSKAASFVSLGNEKNKEQKNKMTDAYNKAIIAAE